MLINSLIMEFKANKHIDMANAFKNEEGDLEWTFKPVINQSKVRVTYFIKHVKNSDSQPKSMNYKYKHDHWSSIDKLIKVNGFDLPNFKHDDMSASKNSGRYIDRKQRNLYLSLNSPTSNSGFDRTESNHRNKLYEDIKPKVYDHLSPSAAKTKVFK